MVLKITGSFVLVCLLATMAFGQGIGIDVGAGDKPTIEAFYFDFSGGGARSEGMGKAFIGLSDDNSAGSWNPAGLYEIENPIMSISYGSLAPRGYTKSFITVNENVRQFDHTGSLGKISFASFVAPLRVKGHQFIGSFSYTRNFDQYQAFTRSDTGWVPRSLSVTVGDVTRTFSDSIYYSGNTNTNFEGGLESINFSVGTRIYKKYTVGVALNVYTGHMVRDVFTSNFFDDVHRSVIDTQIVDAIYTTEVLDSNKFSGFNVTLGAKYNGEKFDAGLVIRTPFSLNVKTGRSYYLIATENGLELNNGTDTVYYDDLLAKYDIPLIVGMGLAYKVKDNLTLALDAEYRAFGSAKVKVRDSLFLDPGGENKEFFTEKDPEWNNVFTIRTGMEFMKESRIGTIPIRAGFGYVPLPFPSVDANGNTSSTNSVSFSLGSGIWWSQIHLDWAYTYSTYSWERSDVFEEKNKDHHFNFTFTGYF